MTKENISITPLGGLGHVGANTIYLCHKKSHLLIDAGILFPKDDTFDINYLIPDYSVLENISDLIITHGHEDHIGAISHIITKFPKIVIHAPLFAATLIRKKLAEHKISHKIKVFNQDEQITIGDITIHPVLVNHSIPDSFGLVIHTKESNSCLFYCSDFKVKSTLENEPKFDFKRLEDLTKNFAHKVLFGDSTNILVKKQSTSEEDVSKSLTELLSTKNKRIYITFFPSNILRFQNIIKAALLNKRKIVLAGRAMKMYLHVARDLGYLEIADKNLVEVESLKPDQKVVILVSGCQGDFKSAFRRIAIGDDGNLVPTCDDTFIFSSKTIPGNELNIIKIKNSLAKVGATVITDKDAKIHSSGHASTEELLTLYKAFKPTHIIPIHGDTFLLQRHFEFIQKNFKSATAHFVTNNDKIIISSDGECTITPRDSTPFVTIHGKNIPLEKEGLTERRKLAMSGIIIISIASDSLSKKNLRFQVHFMGLPLIFENHANSLNNLIRQNVFNHKFSENYVLEDLKIDVRKFAKLHLGYKPVTIIQLV